MNLFFNQAETSSNKSVNQHEDAQAGNERPGNGLIQGEDSRPLQAGMWARNLVIVVVIFLMVAVGLAVWWQAGNRQWRSDPASLRQTNALAQVEADAKRVPPALPDDFFGSFTKQADDTTLKIKLPERDSSSNTRIFEATVHRLQPGKSVPFGPGAASLEYISIGYGSPDLENLKPNADVQVPGKYFDGNLKPMPEQVVEKKFDRWTRTRRYRGLFPEVRFVVRFDGVPDFKVLGGQVLDARTGENLCSGYSYGPEEQSASLQTELQVWHQTPVWVVFDIAQGPLETEDVVPKEGLRITHAWGVMQLAAIREGDQTGFSSFGTSGNSEVTLRFQTASEKAETSFVFLGWPSAHPVPVDFEFLGEDGKKLGGGGGSSSDFVKAQSVRAKRQEIQLMRIKRYPHVRRLVLELPEIPGLPESNRGVNNLFDVKVPYAWFNRTLEMQQFVERTLQLQWQGTKPAAAPPGYFPRVYTNATVREIFRDYLALQPGRVDMQIDPQRHRIEVRPPFWERLWEQIRRSLHW